jgi:hypothetical protein
MVIRYWFVLLALCGASAVQAQSAYAAELSEATDAVAAMLARADKVTVRQKALPLGAMTDSIELQLRLSTLSSQAAQSIGMAGQAGGRPDQNMLLVASAADSLLLTHKLVQRYLDTRDRIYLRQAAAAFQIAKNLRAPIR